MYATALRRQTYRLVQFAVMEGLLTLVLRANSNQEPNATETPLQTHRHVQLVGTEGLRTLVLLAISQQELNATALNLQIRRFAANVLLYLVVHALLVPLHWPVGVRKFNVMMAS